MKSLPSEAVALCLTGELRTLLSLPVRQSYERHVIHAMDRQYSVDAHLAIVVPTAMNTKERQHLRYELRSAYDPRSIEFLNDTASSAVLLQGNSRCKLDTTSRWANARGDLSVLAQWHAIGICYDSCETYERESGRLYSWMMRLRTDLVHFSNVAQLRVLSTDLVYVPSTGMTGDPAYRCMNDQAFLCPRRLCRPYFRLLELFSSPHCMAGGGLACQIRTDTLVSIPERGLFVFSSRSRSRSRSF